MSFILDTNILLRMAEPTHLQHQAANRSGVLLLKSDDSVHVIPQVLYEFWVVATRSIEQNGLGYTTDQADTELQKIQSIFPLLSDTAEIFAEWARLVKEHDVKGKNAHDARIAAAMNIHRVSNLLTFNASDFARFPTIRPVAPDDIING